MKEITIMVPEYDKIPTNPVHDDKLTFLWEDNVKIEMEYDYSKDLESYDTFDFLTINANREGLIALAKHLLFLAQDETPKLELELECPEICEESEDDHTSLPEEVRNLLDTLKQSDLSGWKDTIKIMILQIR